MPNPLDYFDAVYVVNLPTRVDRRDEMIEQLARVGKRLGHGNIHLFEAVRPDDPGPFPSTGARGCFMSHLGILQDANTHGFGRILILEDDLNFSSDFVVRGEVILERLSTTDWGMFYGGYEALDTASITVDGLALLEPADSLRTSHFVGLRRPAIAAAAAYLQAMLARPAGDAAGGPMHVDGAYAWFRRAHPNFPTYAALPELGHQRSSRTDIHPLRWFDRWPIVRDFVGALRRRRNLH